MNKSKSFLSISLMVSVLLAMSQSSLAASPATSHQNVPQSSPANNNPLTVSNNQLPPMVPGVVLIGFKPGVATKFQIANAQTSDATLNTTLAALGVQSIEPVFPGSSGLKLPVIGNSLNNIYRLRLAPDADVLQAVRELSANPAVAYAEPDYLAHIIVTPNDTLYASQWALAQIAAPAAWDVVTGTTDIAIAVVDAGIDASHPDLSGQLWVNPGEIAGNGLDDDSNGYVDDVNGWNLVNNNANLSDNTGHGTEVAGIIAAATNNGAGLAGVCWQCRLMVVNSNSKFGPIGD